MMFWIVTHLEIVIAALLVLVAGVVLLQQRRTPQSTVAWLLAMVAVPYFAVPLFLALGFRKRRARFRPIAFAPHGGGVPEKVAQSDQILQRLGLPPAATGNWFTLIETGEEAWRELIALVDSAEYSLEVEFYVLLNDDVGRAFVEALTRRAKQGVKVRLLLDRLGSLFPPRAALSALRQAGGEVLFFSPLLQLPRVGHVNLRNHRKLVITDGERVFSGGMNVGGEYMGPYPVPDRWIDLAFILEGPAVPACHDVFLSDWAVAGGEKLDVTAEPEPAGTAIVQTVSSGPDMATDPLHDVLVSAIHAAQRRVWVVTPYFLPTEMLSHALVLAARRGIDVRILLPQKSNQKLADFARGAYLREVAEAGARVMFFQKGMLHAKATFIDDFAYAGSANFDVRSMLLNFEFVLFLYDEGSVGTLEDWYLRQEPACREGLAQAGVARRVLEGVFRLGAPVL